MAASTAVTAASGIAARSRVVSLDVVRGAVMVLMAIDHVRVYSGVPAGGPTAVSSLRAGSHISVRRSSSSWPERPRFSSCGRSRDKRCARPVSRHARPDAGRARTHGHSHSLDVQRRLQRAHSCRCDLDARLVHGAAGRRSSGCRHGQSPLSAFSSLWDRGCCHGSRPEAATRRSGCGSSSISGARSVSVKAVRPSRCCTRSCRGSA